MQKVSPIFSEKDKVVSFALHPFGIVFYDVERSLGIETERTGYAQRIVYIFGEVADVEDGLMFGKWRINPQ